MERSSRWRASIDFFLADDMYIFFILLLVITHTLSFFLGYIIAGGDFGSRYLQAFQAYYRLTWSHRDVAWDWQQLFSFFGLTIHRPAESSAFAAFIVAISYQLRGHLRA